MKYKLNNITFAASLIFIFSISIYFILQSIRSENLNQYLDFLGTKLMAMLPEDKKNEEVAQLYDQFKQKVEEKKVAPATVEQLAAEILNLENLEDTLRLKKVQQAMVLALNIPVLADTQVSVSVAMAPEAAGYIPNPGDEQKWRELGEHLQKVYTFEENLKQYEKQKDLFNRQYFKYDSNLQVIIDSQLRQNMLRDADRALIKSIKELEKQKWLVWKENYDKELKEQMKALQESMTALKIAHTGKSVLPDVRVRLPEPDSIRINIVLPADSLLIPSVPAP